MYNEAARLRNSVKGS